MQLGGRGRYGEVRRRSRYGDGRGTVRWRRLEQLPSPVPTGTRASHPALLTDGDGDQSPDDSASRGGRERIGGGDGGGRGRRTVALAAGKGGGGGEP